MGRGCLHASFRAKRRGQVPHAQQNSIPKLFLEDRRRPKPKRRASGDFGSDCSVSDVLNTTRQSQKVRYQHRNEGRKETKSQADILNLRKKRSGREEACGDIKDSARQAGQQLYRGAVTSMAKSAEREGVATQVGRQFVGKNFGTCTSQGYLKKYMRSEEQRTVLLLATLQSSGVQQ